MLKLRYLHLLVTFFILISCIFFIVYSLPLLFKKENHFLLSGHYNSKTQKEAFADDVEWFNELWKEYYSDNKAKIKTRQVEENEADWHCFGDSCVEEIEDIGKQPKCNYFNGCGCVDEYINFIHKALVYAKPISEESLASKFNNIKYNSIQLLKNPLPSEDFSDILSTKLNMKFLIEGLKNMKLKVTTTNSQDTENCQIIHYLFEDYYIGEFSGILLLPKRKKATLLPAVLAVHGHSSSAQSYIDEFNGYEYPKHGYALLVISLRALCGPPAESIVTRILLLHGFNFMALECYESLLGLKYLKHLPFIDAKNIGLIGHSAGSAINNLSIRISPYGFKASVVDNTVSYLSDQKSWQFVLYNDNIPDIYYYHLLINNFNYSPIPVLKVPYGYIDDNGINCISDIFSFFDKHLKNT